MDGYFGENVLADGFHLNSLAFGLSRFFIIGPFESLESLTVAISLSFVEGSVSVFCGELVAGISASLDVCSVGWRVVSLSLPSLFGRLGDDFCCLLLSLFLSAGGTYTLGSRTREPR